MRPAVEEMRAAQDRVRLAALWCADGAPPPSRIAARRAAGEGARVDEDGLTPAQIRAIVNEEARESLFRHAAALRSANDIAAVVSGEGRAALIEILGEEARRFALTHRAQSRPQRGLATGPLIEEVESDMRDIRKAWGGLLPTRLKRKLGFEEEAVAVDPALPAALSAAEVSLLGPLGES